MTTQAPPDPVAKLRERFIARARGDLPALKAFGREDEGLDAGEPREALIGTAHSLAGSGGTFGCPEVSRRAEALETLLISQASPDPAEIRAALGRLIEEIERL
jgi:HPt (histidine-containing phosphotransfer) domain-containing protein